MAVTPIVISGLVFRRGGRAVLDGLTASIAATGITAIVGPNGAGKSVTLRILDGLLQPDAGEVRFGRGAGADVRRALVFQRPALIRASVEANVALGLAAAGSGLGRAARRERIAAALHRVGLGDRARDPARKLSGGEQQRLALARALVGGPDLLLLDEPTANLDPGATEAIEELVRGEAAAGTKVILVSHNLGQVARLADDLLVLDRGRAVEHGPAQAVLQAPRTAEARAYLKGELPWTAFAAA
ncbi:ATP-binding cassette domain-containing protein [Enterovirga aerilata]|uniref:ATP-binding cassette domain-containing protein n=1 Tax=Enterovirga aerilata TaxID=2730920 RepID=A0A849ILA2_9HYPH|nr:ATP-binding cassette domain-containing protein [Enterovirga sp. DB1703]NNM74733.1 ATP-binding cassette domain-containing protein [Enterovirga sp. DB1703]